MYMYSVHWASLVTWCDLFEFRLRAKELSQQLDRAHKQIADLERRLIQRNTEFDSLRDHIHNKSESRIQAELSVLQLEKASLCLHKL